jgi:hypothetical protein
MRKLALLPLIALSLACQDTTPVEPDLAYVSGPAQIQTVDRGQRIMVPVPFKATGDWWIVGYDFTQCEGESGLVSVFMEAEIRGTHVGRSQMAFSACWDVDDFVSTQGTITAANGDVLNFRGSAAEDGTTHPFFPDGTWTLGPVSIIGGTGRFQNAQGEYNGHGTFDGETGGTMVSEGWVSSIGSGK